MANPLWMRLRAIDWTTYDLPTTSAKKIPKLLADLSSHKEVRSMRASQQLWSLLKPGSSASAAALPFLRDIKAIASSDVCREIDDLIIKLES